LFESAALASRKGKSPKVSDREVIGSEKVKKSC
jgi:hypothetical protein